MFEKIYVPSSGGYSVPVDAYVPETPGELLPDIDRPAIVLFPGGGYTHLGNREAEPVAMRFVTLGYNVFTVTYRYEPHYYPVPMQDGAAVIAYVRRHARELLTDPNRIAVMGFSAGGHLAGFLGTTWQKNLYADMGLTPEEIKPNAMVLGYPVLTAGEFANRGSFDALTGSRDVKDHAAFSVENLVTEDCPPAFLWTSFDDTVVPCESSLLMGLALSRKKIPAELHVFRHGPHGAALYNEVSAGRDRDMIVPEMACWPELAAGFLSKVMP